MPFGLPKFSQDVTLLTGNSTTAGASWIPWYKPAGACTVDIVIVGRGGGGGTGVVGANSTAAGGGGGGSGALTRVSFPAYLIPEVLYFSGGAAGAGAGFESLLAIYPSTSANTILARANGGGVGGNASGATAGAAGTAGAIVTAGTMPLGTAIGTTYAVAGQAGIIGGTTGAGAALTLPVTGLIITGGTGGAGLGAAGTNGTNGGSFTVPSAPSPLNIPHAGGVGSTAATTAPGRGTGGLNFVLGEMKVPYFFGGTGGGSTHGTATGAGLVQAAGGNGGLGCGGGGMGGALTGSTAASASLGGAGFCLISVT